MSIKPPKVKGLNKKINVAGRGTREMIYIRMNEDGFIIKDVGVAPAGAFRSRKSAY